MHIYIHIPFCAQKCSYCKFAVTPIFDTFKRKKYIHFLKREIQSGIKKYKINTIDSIYFGGGTPSLLTPQEISDILSIFKGKITKNTEITLEGNPEDFTEDFVSEIIPLGVNRISLGVQSLNPKTLHTVGRSEVKNIHMALKNIKPYKNTALNVDFILGLPHVKSGETLKNIQFLYEKYPHISHTSVYILEKGVYPKSWKKISMQDEAINQDFLEIIKYFRERSWNRYEYSNWAKSGNECLHNRGYWNHSNSIGFGLSASSFFEGKRWTNALSFSGYYRGKRYFEEVLSSENLHIEKIMFGLRTGGVEKKILENTPYLCEYLENGYLEEKDEKVILTDKGNFLIDTILADII